MKADRYHSTMDADTRPDEGVSSPPFRLGRESLALLSVLVFAAVWLSPLLEVGFTGDDYHLVELLHRGQGGPDQLTSWGAIGHYVVHPMSEKFSLYRPVVTASFGINLMAGGLDERAFAATNLMLHLVVGALLFILIGMRCPTSPLLWRSLAVLAFLTSPLVSETVSWSSARSETFSALFGLGALLLAGQGRHRWALASCALALLSKESAVVFPLLVGLDAWFVTGRIGDRGAFVRRAIPLGLLVVLWLLVRSLVLGGLVGHYGHVEGGGVALLPWVGRALQAFSVLIAPVGSLLLDSSSARIALLVLEVVAALGALALLLRCPMARGGRLQVAVLIAVPLILSVFVNPVTFKLVGTRACYTPLLGWALILAATGRLRGHLTLMPLLTVVLIGLTLSRPSQRLHVKTYRNMRATIDSLRTPLADLATAPVDTLAVLSYHEARYFDDSYDMSSGIRAALRPPFTAKPWELAKVTCASPTQPGWHEDFVVFDRLVSEEPGRLAFFRLRALEDDGERPLYELASGGFLPPPPGSLLEATTPRDGAKLHIVLSSPDPLAASARFDFTEENLGATSYRFSLSECDHWPEEYPPLRPGDLPSRTEGSRTVRTVIIPATILRAFGEVRNRPMIWIVEARDAKGRVLARTRPAFFRVDIVP